MGATLRTPQEPTTLGPNLGVHPRIPCGPLLGAHPRGVQPLTPTRWGPPHWGPTKPHWGLPQGLPPRDNQQPWVQQPGSHLLGPTHGVPPVGLTHNYYQDLITDYVPCALEPITNLCLSMKKFTQFEMVMMKLYLLILYPHVRSFLT